MESVVRRCSPLGGNHRAGGGRWWIPEVPEVRELPRWSNPGLSRIETLSSPRGGRGANGVQWAFTRVNKVEKDFKKPTSPAHPSTLPPKSSGLRRAFEFLLRCCKVLSCNKLLPHDEAELRDACPAVNRKRRKNPPPANLAGDVGAVISN